MINSEVFMNQKEINRRQIVVWEGGDSKGWKVTIVKDKETGETLLREETLNNEPYIPSEEESNQYNAKLPTNDKNVENIEVRDTKTGEITKTLNKAQELNLTQGLSILVPESEIQSWQKTLLPTENFNEEEKKQMKQAIEKIIENNQSELISVTEVAQALELIISTQGVIPQKFYKNLDKNDEFNVVRLLADKIYHLQKLLDSLTIIKQGETTTYLLQSEIKDSKDNSIKLEHRLQATTEEEAIKLGKIIKKKLNGIALKVCLGCWAIANEKGNFTFTCPLTALMDRCNPNRNVYFNTEEKAEFYESIRILENTKFVITKFYKKTGRKEQYESYELKLLEIHKHSGEKDEPPTYLTLSVFNPNNLPYKEKLAFVGVGVKHKTLELHADDTSLATVIQIRKNQMMHDEYISLTRDLLIEKAGLAKTNKSNKSHANKLLLNKLKRLSDGGIILSLPQKITDVIALKVR